MNTIGRRFRPGTTAQVGVLKLVVRGSFSLKGLSR